MGPLSSAGTKRGPTVLVQDAREQKPQQLRRPQSRFITVDSVLQYASEIPSMQQRIPQRPLRSSLHPGGGSVAERMGAGRSLDPRVTGRFVTPHMPPRSTKLSEKLVLLPETVDEAVEKEDFDPDHEAAPPKDHESLEERRPGRGRGKSYAERLPKSRRTEKDLARVTAYCTAQAYKMKSIAAFIRDRHAARTKLYDDCLYAAYHLPLLPGVDGYRVRCSPPLKSAGGKAVLDEAIEQSEQGDYHAAYFAEDEEQHSVRNAESPQEADAKMFADPDIEATTPQESPDRPQDVDDDLITLTDNVSTNTIKNQDVPESATQNNIASNNPPAKPIPVAEMFVFSYGVVVFWNFAERQEKDVLADLTFSCSLDPKTNVSAPLSLATLPLNEEDFETEEFHLQYDDDISRPRVYNDMITLRTSGGHMVKLAISHAIAQSTKLSFFEETMATQMEEAKDVPKRLALTGELGMKREDIVKILGGLFKSRVDVNLSSNVLDVPNLIWESEPTLHPLYSAVREYLEIKPRIQVLNERCRVFLDLAEILSEYISDNKMDRLTWIIIVLICLSIVVTCGEVFLRFGILEARNARGDASVSVRPESAAAGMAFGSDFATVPVASVSECVAVDGHDPVQIDALCAAQQQRQQQALPPSQSRSKK